MSWEIADIEFVSWLGGMQKYFHGKANFGYVGLRLFDVDLG